MCHNCTAHIGWKEYVSGEELPDEDSVYEQCDACSELPANPRAIPEHVTQMRQIDSEESRGRCIYCNEAVCMCQYCPVHGVVFTTKTEYTSCPLHPCDEVLLSREQAVNMGLICLGCGGVLNCACQDLDNEETDDEEMDELVIANDEGSDEEVR